MSIVIIRGPDKPMQHRRDPLSQSLHGEIITGLVDSAVCAGRTLAIRSCCSDKEVIDTLAIIQRFTPEVLLIDPGTSLGDPEVCDALRRCGVPYIEIHDDTSIAMEPELQGAAGQRIGIVHGYMAQGYTRAMSMALEHLGCGECEFEYHVGT